MRKCSVFRAMCSAKVHLKCDKTLTADLIAFINDENIPGLCYICKMRRTKSPITSETANSESKIDVRMAALESKFCSLEERLTSQDSLRLQVDLEDRSTVRPLETPSGDGLKSWAQVAKIDGNPITEQLNVASKIAPLKAKCVSVDIEEKSSKNTYRNCLSGLSVICTHVK